MVTEEAVRGLAEESGPPGDLTLAETPPEELSSNEAALGVINGFTILAAARARLPEEVHIANLSGKGFERFEEEDLGFFENLKLLDVSDNDLASIEELSKLRQLVELRCPVNSLSGALNIFPGAFAALKVLDVSYNHLDSGVVEELGTLPSLVKLDVSGNNFVGDLPALPPPPKTERKQAQEAGGNSGAVGGFVFFPCLQTLIAERTNFGTFDLASLQHLPRLRELRLSGNPITEITAECSDGFQSLETLDLSHCRFSSLDSVAPAKTFARLRRLLLHGNPLVPQQRLSRHALSGKIALADPEEAGLKGGKIGGNSRSKRNCAISEMYNMKLRKANLDYPMSRMEAFGSLSHGDIDETFERLKEPMSIFDEEDYEYDDAAAGSSGRDSGDDGDDSGAEEGGTFLTSLVEEAEEKEAKPKSRDADRDPSGKLARAFGLDPDKVFSVDHLGLDATAAINALKFALDHPLIDHNDNGKILPHMKLTESALRKKLETRRFSPMKSAQKHKPSKRKEAIQDMLERMKEKLALAKEKISAVPA